MKYLTTIVGVIISFNLLTIDSAASDGIEGGFESVVPFDSAASNNQLYAPVQFHLDLENKKVSLTTFIPVEVPQTSGGMATNVMPIFLNEVKIEENAAAGEEMPEMLPPTKLPGTELRALALRRAGPSYQFEHSDRLVRFHSPRLLDGSFRLDPSFRKLVTPKIDLWKPVRTMGKIQSYTDGLCTTYHVVLRFFTTNPADKNEIEIGSLELDVAILPKEIPGK